MRILIVESGPELGRLWQAHLERAGCEVTSARTQGEAVAALQENSVSLIILDLILEEGSAFAVADYAAFRYPQTPVIFVTNTTFFSDGSIFRHIPNARAFVQSATPPEDLAAMVQYYASAG